MSERGGGGFIYVLRCMGYDATGLEPNEGYAGFASDVLKLPVKFGFYQDAAVPRESQDIVTMFHVVEHLESPADVIEVVWDWLRPKGFLVIEVPNVEAVCQHPHTQFHVGHLYHFNLVTLQKLGETHGYSVVESFTSPDGGNIAVVFQKTDNSFKGGSETPKNYERVRTVLKRHTAFRHFCSGYPFIRPIQKAYQRLRELWWVQSNKSPKKLLDALVNSRLGRTAEASAEQKHD